jgi:hypothetical protein
MLGHRTILLLYLLLSLALAACSAEAPSGGSALSNSGGSTTGRQVEAAKSAEVAPARSVPGAPPVSAATAAPAAAAKPPAEAARPAGGAGAPAQAADQVKPSGAPLPSDQKIIRTGKIDLIVADIAGSLRTVSGLVTASGGYIQQSASREQGGTAIAELILRVPVDQYENVFQRLRDLAVPDRKPIESSEAQDVTEEFADVQARLTNLKATEAQLLRLMARAEKMEDILVVQRELTNVREQIERLQGRLNVIERRAAFSTINVTLRPQAEARRPQPPSLQQPGFNAVNVSGRPSFSWAVSDGALSYSLQVTSEVDTTFANPLLNLDKLTVTSVDWPDTIEELRQSNVYRWRVRASNAAGESDWTASRTFSTVPAWSPLRTIGESWAASLSFLQRAIDILLRLVVFFWWLLPLLGLFFFFIGRWRRTRRRPLPPSPPPSPPTVSPPPVPPAGQGASV